MNDSPTKSTGRSAMLVAAGVALSRVSGLLREVVLAGFLGTTKVADAFRAALQIPGLLQNVLGEGVLSASFIPVYSELLDKDEEQAGRVAGAVAGLLGMLTFVIVGIGILAAEPIITTLLWNLPDDTLALTVDLSRIMWAGLGFVVLAAWCLGVLNSHRRFFLSYVSPVLWNLSQVALASYAWLSGWDSADVARAAAWGVFIGGALQFLVQVPLVLRVEPHLRLSLAYQIPGVRTVIRRFGPAVLGRGVVQLSAFLDLFLASLLAAGAIAGLQLAQVIYLLPIGVFAMSIAAADLPELSREQQRIAHLAARIRTGMERTTFFVLYSAIAFIACGKPLVGALFQRGEFTEDDTVFVWLVLAGYSLGLVPSASSRILQNALFAEGDVKTPAKLALVRVIIAAVVGFVLMLQFEHLAVVDGSIESFDTASLPTLELLPESVRDNELAPQRLGAVGLALGSAVGAWVEYGLLRRRVRVSLRRMRRLGWPARILAPAGVLSFVVGLALSYWVDDLEPIIGATVAIGLSGTLYVLIANLRGSPTAAGLLRVARIPH